MLKAPGKRRGELVCLLKWGKLLRERGKDFLWLYCSTMLQLTGVVGDLLLERKREDSLLLYPVQDSQTPSTAIGCLYQVPGRVLPSSNPALLLDRVVLIPVLGRRGI